ncbi:MAG: tetratricopeptide repeat protein [Rubrivivax sp.]
MKRPFSPMLALVAFFALTVAFGTAHAQGLRAEIGKPLQQAADYIKAGKGREALAKVREAEAVPNRTPAEQLMLDRMKAAAAQRAGDMATAVQALEAVHPRTSGAEAGQIAEQIASGYAQLKNVPKAAEWVTKAQQAGNNSATLKQLQSYLQGASGDYAAIAKDAAAAVTAAEQAGGRPSEADLLRLADAQQRTGQTAAQIGTLEKLLTLYPKKDYWNAYLSRLPRKPNFADRFGLDVMRLKLATGNLTRPEDFMEMAQLAMQVGLPAEGLQIVEKGLAAGVLGVGPDSDRHKRLRDLAVKKTAEAKAGIAAQATEAAAQKTGDDLVRVGYAYVGLGEVDKGIALIEQGIAKGGLKRPEDAKLRLGMAQLSRNKAKALQTLRSVGGSDGSADIARLWVIAGA